MKMLVIVVVLLFLTGCGYSSRDNELIGQPKKIIRLTPIICPEFSEIDISLGVLRNGVGSVSTQDIWLRIMNSADVVKLQQFIERGVLIKVKYDSRRATVCYPDHNLLWVEEVK